MNFTYLTKINSSMFDEVKKNASQSSDLSAYIIDFSDESSSNLMLPEDLNTPVILLNTTNESKLNDVICLIPSGISILYRSEEFNCLKLIITEDDVRTIKSAVEYNTLENKPNIAQEVANAQVEISSKETPRPDFSLIEVISSLIKDEARDDIFKSINEERNRVNSLPVNLPKGQYKVQFVSIPNDHRLPDDQIARWDVMFQFEVIASYNPECKYLRISTVGAGVTPNEMVMDTGMKKYWFQSHISISMKTSSNDVSIYSHSPSNINGETQYTSGSSFSIGVDISKNPGFSPSYTFSEQRTTSIKDFLIINKTIDKHPAWEYRLGYFGVNDNWSGLYSKEFYGFEGRHLPTLATQNLQPICEAVFKTNGNTNNQVNFNFSVSARYGKLILDNGWVSHARYWYHDGHLEKNININFGEVSA